jgi:hypothetical protein
MRPCKTAQPQAAKVVSGPNTTTDETGVKADHVAMGASAGQVKA